MNTKTFIISKIGYTTGIYGCSGEYFNCIVINGDKIIGFVFQGLYGAESRVAQALKDRGYTDKYLPLSIYGKLTRKDGIKLALSEYSAITNIDELLNRGYIEYNKE